MKPNVESFSLRQFLEFFSLHVPVAVLSFEDHSVLAHGSSFDIIGNAGDLILDLPVLWISPDTDPDSRCLRMVVIVDG